MIPWRKVSTAWFAHAWGHPQLQVRGWCVSFKVCLTSLLCISETFGIFCSSFFWLFLNGFHDITGASNPSCHVVDADAVIHWPLGSFLVETMDCPFWKWQNFKSVYLVCFMVELFRCPELEPCVLEPFLSECFSSHHFLQDWCGPSNLDRHLSIFVCHLPLHVTWLPTCSNQPPEFFWNGAVRVFVQRPRQWWLASPTMMLGLTYHTHTHDCLNGQILLICFSIVFN